MNKPFTTNEYICPRCGSTSTAPKSRNPKLRRQCLTCNRSYTVDGRLASEPQPNPRTYISVGLKTETRQALQDLALTRQQSISGLCSDLLEDAAENWT